MNNDKATTIKLFKMLMEWRKTKSIALAYDICETVVSQDGIFVIYEPFSRCLISFVGISLDKKFVKTVKEHDVACYADFSKLK